MNRKEALRLLGLDEDATIEDIKVAYKETVQILHPDKFSGNKKLQNRATEQFKNLQESYDYLTKGKGARASAGVGSDRGAGSAGRSGAGAGVGARSGSSVKSRASAGAGDSTDYYEDSDTYYSDAYAVREIEARLAGIAAAKTQLVAQRDVAYDERRNGCIMTGIGVLVALFFGRKPSPVFMLIATLAGTAALWGITQVISATRTINTLNEHVRKLTKEKKKLQQQLEEFE